MIPQGRFLRGFFHCSGRLSWILEVPSISGPMIQSPRLAVVEGSTRRHENSSGIWPVGSLNWVSEVKGQITLAGICQLPGNKKWSPRVPGYLGEGEEAEEEGRNTLIAQFSSEAAVPVVTHGQVRAGQRGWGSAVQEEGILPPQQTSGRAAAGEDVHGASTAPSVKKNISCILYLR